ncbi:MAG TPA: serine/threonine-protein kinase [Polyangia bacterium]|nr:serine/threonine-protein kinase [Polyangia bacterium]
MPTADIHRIGRYVNLTLLGQGGMGAVYRGRDPELERPVAVKVMLDSTPDFVARFRREAQSIARLTHANIVQVYDFGVDGEGNPYFVMELIDGTPLDKIIRDRGRLAPADAVNLARQAAEGLAAAHRAGIVHRDVKPSNLIVDGRGGVKLVDFGIARVREGGGAQLTNAAALMGTPGYMAPEQAAGGKPVDHRADIYALGLTLYEMLAGHPPFQADDPISLVVKNMQEPLPDLRMSSDGIPEELVRLVEQMGMKNPDDRLQSCEAVIAALDGIAQQVGPRTAHDLARADTDRIPPTNVHAKREQVVAAAAALPSTGGAKKKSPATIGAIAGIGVVAIGLAVFLVTHKGTQTPTAVITPPTPLTKDGPRTDNANVRPADVSANVKPSTNDGVKTNPNAVLARPGNDTGSGPLRISILPFKNSSKDPQLVTFEEGVAETAVNTFYESHKGGNVKFFERTQADQAIGEIDLAGNFHFDPDTVAKLGKLKGAQVIVVGGVQLADKKVRITGRFVRVEDGQVLDVFTVTSKTNHGFKAQDEVAAGLAAKLEALASNWRQK